MKNLKKFFLFFLVFSFGFSAGITVYKFNIPPIPQIKFIKYFFFKPELFKKLVEGEVEVFVMKYTKGVPLYSNRPYVDTVGPKELEGLTLIQIPRHYRERIRIETKKPITVYRLVTESNDDWLMEGYEKTALKVNVVGRSIYRGVMKRSFPPGSVVLYPGGPSSASPILIGPPESGPLPMTIYIN